MGPIRESRAAAPRLLFGKSAVPLKRRRREGPRLSREQLAMREIQIAFICDPHIALLDLLNERLRIEFP